MYLRWDDVILLPGKLEMWELQGLYIVRHTLVALSACSSL